MTLPTDQTLKTEKLSPTSLKMLELKEKVLAEWEKRTRDALGDARDLRHPVIINTIPSFYDNIVEALSPELLRETGVSSSTLAAEHGGERARLTNYDPKELVLEYQIFRATLIEVLNEDRVQLTSKELHTVNSSIDDSIREAVTAFSLVVAGLREQFIAALTHDMRSPLHSAGMAAELITLTTDSPKTRELAQRVRENIDRVDNMIQGLLDTMVFQQGERLRLQLSHFDVLELLKEVCRNSVEMGSRCRISGEPVYGWWSRDAIKRAVENLGGNAVKYGTPDTPITIRVKSEHDRLLLTVHNEGPPIPIDEQESIFQIFRRASDAKVGRQQGWGIGLPYVRAVAESHGGSVEVDSSLDKGTTLLLDIPVDSRPYQDAPTLAMAG